MAIGKKVWVGGRVHYVVGGDDGLAEETTCPTCHRLVLAAYDEDGTPIYYDPDLFKPLREE